MTEDESICASTSPSTGNYFDLSPLIRQAPEDSSDWHVRGWDFGANFTVNICSPALSSPQIAGAQNVSAYYTDKAGQSYSIGSSSTKPFFRGRNLLLEYKDGSPCYKDGEKTPLRKSSTFSFKCDRDLTSIHRGIVSYVSSMDDCAFFFEVRTPHACPSVDSRHSASPVFIFFLITLVAVAVYYAGSMIFRPAVLNKLGLGRFVMRKKLPEGDALYAS